MEKKGLNLKHLKTERKNLKKGGLRRLIFSDYTSFSTEDSYWLKAGMRRTPGLFPFSKLPSPLSSLSARAPLLVAQRNTVEIAV